MARRNKHLSPGERTQIENSLDSGESFKAIALKLGRDCTTISKEVGRHRDMVRKGAYGKPFNDCVYRFSCRQGSLCGVLNCRHELCRFCKKCNSVCQEYRKEVCSRLSKAPYVCNSCTERQKCTLERTFYRAGRAQNEYQQLLRESRNGITLDEAELQRLNELISPLLKQGQSLYHISCSHGDSIMRCEKTLYKYVDSGLFHARNIDLPRKVKLRPRKKQGLVFKVDKKCRIGRTLEDCAAFMSENPDTPVVQMDTLEGVRGGKVLLTIHFVESMLMLAFLRDANTSRSVIDIFEKLYASIGAESFKDIFQLIKTDNGSEFSNPAAIEFDAAGNRRTRIFYCDPSSPYQKGALENNHEFIRKVIRKGGALDCYTQEGISLMMDHINSYTRKKLSGKSPFDAFSFFHGSDILEKFGVKRINADEISLTPELLKK